MPIQRVYQVVLPKVPALRLERKEREKQGLPLENPAIYHFSNGFYTSYKITHSQKFPKSYSLVCTHMNIATQTQWFILKGTPRLLIVVPGMTVQDPNHIAKRP